MIKIIRHNDGTHGWEAGSLPEPRPARKLPIIVAVREMPEEFSVQTLEGTMEGKKGDILITGIKGEMYPCDRDVLFASYEFADSESARARP